MYGVNDVAWVVVLAILAFLFVAALVTTVYRHGRRPSGPAMAAKGEPGSFAPRTFADDLGGQVEAVIFVYQLERHERPIARDLRRLAARFGPEIKPRWQGDPP